MKQIVLTINVSEERSREVLVEISKFTAAISNACGTITQSVNSM